MQKVQYKTLKRLEHRMEEGKKKKKFAIADKLKKFKKSKKKIIGIVVLIVIVIVGYPFVLDKFTKTTYISSSELEKVVNISELSTARVRYNGIADITNDKGKIKYHVYYEATVTGNVDMSEISFEVDNKERTVRPILPEVNFDKPVVDGESYDFLPKDANVNMKDVIKSCKNDVREEVKANKEIYQLAENNLRQVVTGLIKPILDAQNYEIIWD